MNYLSIYQNWYAGIYVNVDTNSPIKFLKVMKLKKDSVYTYNGSEKFINSGPLLSLDKEQNFDYSFSTSFTVVFNKPGFFEYTCLFHPWMIGKLLVKP